jgi:hypothetical protein
MPGDQNYWNDLYDVERLQAIAQSAKKPNVDNRQSKYAYYQALRRLLVIYSDANAWSTNLSKIGRFFKKQGGKYADKIAEFLKNNGHMSLLSTAQELSDDYDKPEATLELLVSSIAELLADETLDTDDDLYKILKAATDKAQLSYLMSSFTVNTVDEDGFAFLGSSK